MPPPFFVPLFSPLRFGLVPLCTPLHCLLRAGLFLGLAPGFTKIILVFHPPFFLLWFVVLLFCAFLVSLPCSRFFNSLDHCVCVCVCVRVCVCARTHLLGLLGLFHFLSSALGPHIFSPPSFFHCAISHPFFPPFLRLFVPAFSFFSIFFS